MNKVICIKTVITKRGTTFKQGQSYDYTINNGAIRVYASDFKFVKINNQSLFNKYFS